MNTFSIGEAVKFGWEKFKINRGLWVATLVFVVLCILSGLNKSGFGIISFIATVALWIAQVGYYKLLLKIVDGETPEWKKALEVMFNTHKVFWKYLGTSVLTGIITFIGFILLIIPGFIAVAALAFATLIVIDTGLRPVAALRESREITKGSRLQILSFFIVIGFLNILGFIALGVGVFVSIPVTMLALVYIYRKLLAAKASPILATPASIA